MAAGSIQDPQALGGRLEGLLEGLLAKRGVRHAVAGVERGDGSFRWTGATGEATPEGAPMGEHTPYFIASVTKLYIAAAVLKLHERGRVSIDERLSVYLDAALLEGLHRLGGVDRTDELTIRHLLGHTSGLPDYLEERPKGGRSLIEQLSDEGDRSCGIEEVVRIVREDLTPHFPPQDLDAPRPKARYSDTNFQLLITIVEAVAGQPMHRALQELLLGPLGLRHTWHPAGSPLDPAPDPATLWFGNDPLELPLALASIGDLYSTVEDQLAFLRALVAGDAFEDPGTAQLMRSRWHRFGFHPTELRQPGWPIEYGLGVMRFAIPRPFAPLRPVPPVVGHTGSTGTWLFHCPELDLFLTGSVDQATAGAVPFRFVPKLLRIVGRGSR